MVKILFERDLNDLALKFLENVKKGFGYSQKKNDFNALLFELLTNEKSKLKDFLEEKGISSITIDRIEKVHFSSNFMDFPSFILSLNKYNSSYDKDICVGQVSIVVYPNCCGLCILYSLSANGYDLETYNLTMTTALYLARLVGYAKAYYTDVIKYGSNGNFYDYGDNKVIKYFKYNKEKDDIENPLWKTIDTIISHRTNRELRTFCHSMEEETPDKYLDYLISYHNSQNYEK